MKAAIFLIALCGLLILVSCSGGAPKVETDPDQAVLTQLKKAGSKMERPHTIEFVLYFPTGENANRAADQIRKNGYAVEVKPAANGNDMLCLARKSMIPNTRNLIESRKLFRRIAKEFNGEYDGWAAPVVK